MDAVSPVRGLESWFGIEGFLAVDEILKDTSRGSVGAHDAIGTPVSRSEELGEGSLLVLFHREQ